jgi:2'-deoxynucleoside 5'-phosphate N-hydrolase
MKAYLGIKFHHDNRNRATIEGISQILGECGFETVCIRRDIEQWGAISLSPQELMIATFDAIRSCQLMLIDLTEKGVGIGIEAGYAYAHSVPVFTIAQEGSEISPTLAGISTDVGFYRTPPHFRHCFVQLGLLAEGTEALRKA